MATPKKPRFPELTPESMSAEQRAAAQGIINGPRGGLRGPFNAWLRSPVFADRMQRVGEYLRFNSSIPADLNEFAILITARVWFPSTAMFIQAVMCAGAVSGRRRTV
jgi:4-carboxymuconolactone decarboxylase